MENSYAGVWNVVLHAFLSFPAHLTYKPCIKRKEAEVGQAKR